MTKKKRIVVSKKATKRTASASIPIQMYGKIETYIEEGLYGNASDFVKTAIKMLIDHEEKKKTHELIEYP